MKPVRQIEAHRLRYEVDVFYLNEDEVERNHTCFRVMYRGGVSYLSNRWHLGWGVSFVESTDLVWISDSVAEDLAELAETARFLDK